MDFGFLMGFMVLAFIGGCSNAIRAARSTAKDGHYESNVMGQLGKLEDQVCQSVCGLCLGDTLIGVQPHLVNAAREGGRQRRDRRSFSLSQPSCLLAVLIGISGQSFMLATMFIALYGGLRHWRRGGINTVFSLLLLLLGSARGGNFEKGFGEPEDEVGNCVTLGSDGNYYIMGSTRSLTAGGADSYVLSIDPMGNKKWGTTFGGALDDIGMTIVEGSDGSLYTSGATKSLGAGGSDFGMRKMDRGGGATAWIQAFGGTLDEIPYGICSYDNGATVVTGSTLSYTAGGTDVWVIMVGTAGNKLWQVNIGDLQDDSGRGVARYGNTDLIVVGYYPPLGFLIDCSV